MAVAEVEGLRKEIGGSGTGPSWPSGGVFGFLGPNGSGRSQHRRRPGGGFAYFLVIENVVGNYLAVAVMAFQRRAVG